MQNKNQKNKSQVVVIVEGHDKTGKSTISAELSNKLSIPIFKLKKNKKQFDQLIDLFYGVESTVQFLEQTGCSVILDRFYPSEYAYSKVNKRFTNIKKILELDKRMSRMNTFIIVCYKDSKMYEIDHADFDTTTPEDYTVLTQTFREFGKSTKCPILFLNTSDKNLKNQIKKILKFIKYDKHIGYL